MPYRTLPTVAAITAFGVVAFCALAFAQKTVGGQQVNDADLPLVEAHCNQLAAELTTSTNEAATDADITADVETEAQEKDDATDETAVNLDVISLKDCQAAGLAPS